jgi:hypothetical protein
MPCMRSTWVVFLIALTHASAQSAAAHADQPLWPPDCTRDMPRDGLVLLDPSALGLAAPAEPATAAQTLEIRLLRTADGTAVAGTLEAPDPATGPLLRWRSQAPLHANTEYKIEARHVATEAMALSGYFTTGDSFLAPLAFSGRPALRLMARAPEPAGEPHGAQVESVLVRIALPPLAGGLTQRALQVSVAWSEADDSERVAGLRGGHEQAALPGETLGFELEAQLRDVPSERCLEIVARDDLGQQIALDPALCVSLPARSASEPPDARAQADDSEATDQEDAPAPDAASEHHEPLEPAEFETLASQQAAAEATQTSQSEGAGAGGCSLSSGHGGPSWAWLLAALPALFRRRRSRIVPG